MTDEEKESLLSWAANMTNRHPDALEGFNHANRMSDVEFAASRPYRQRMYASLKECRALPSPLIHLIGYWYGRITDPRWDDE